MGENLNGIVFFNIDGVLLNDKGDLEFSMIVGMKNLKWKGYLPIVVTDKTYQESQIVLRRLGITTYVCDSGNTVVHNDYKIIKIKRSSTENIQSTLDIGIKTIMENYQDESLETYAFGNTEEDKIIFNYGKTKIAMGNACEEVKRNSDFITTKNSEHGVIEALRALELI